MKERGAVPVEEFRAEFEARVIGTGHVLSMLAPWSAPLNLNRIWVAAMGDRLSDCVECSVSLRFSWYFHFKVHM